MRECPLWVVPDLPSGFQAVGLNRGQAIPSRTVEYPDLFGSILCTLSLNIFFTKVLYILS